MLSADEVLNTLLISSDLSPLILTAIISGVTSFVPIPQMKKQCRKVSSLPEGTQSCVEYPEIKLKLLGLKTYDFTIYVTTYFNIESC